MSWCLEWRTLTMLNAQLCNGTTLAAFNIRVSSGAHHEALASRSNATIWAVQKPPWAKSAVSKCNYGTTNVVLVGLHIRSVCVEL
jgi:hypothetical protein